MTLQDYFTTTLEYVLYPVLAGVFLFGIISLIHQVWLYLHPKREGNRN